jgi:hypothetical protein
MRTTHDLVRADAIGDGLGRKHGVMIQKNVFEPKSSAMSVERGAKLRRSRVKQLNR